MRLALAVSGHRPAGEAVLLARLAEEAGLAQVWVSEDYCERGAFALAGAMAAVTSRVEVGVGVVNPFTRHPMLLAMEWAALEEVSGGRSVLGLGASNRRWMEEELGIPFERPLGRLREAVAILRSAMAGEAVAHRGRHFSVDARLAFAPPRGRPPLVLGAKGPGMLGLAGSLADGVLLSTLASPPYVGWVRRRLPAGTEVAGYVTLAHDDDLGAARDRLRPVVATFLGVHGDQEITRQGGLDPGRAAELRAGWLAGHPRVDLVDDALVDAFAVAGDRGRCIRGLARFARAGLDVAVLRDDGTTAPEALVASLVSLSGA